MRKVTITECWNQTPVIVRLTSQRSATWQSDGKLVMKEAGPRVLFHQSTQCHTVVRWKALRKVAGLTAQRGTFVSHPEQLSSVLRGPGAVSPFGPSLSEPEPGGLHIINNTGYFLRLQFEGREQQHTELK